MAEIDILLPFAGFVKIGNLETAFHRYWGLMLISVAARALRLHPLARPAFEAWAGLGELGLSGAPIRAVEVDGAFLAFAGLARLHRAWEGDCQIEVAQGLSNAQIKAASWVEIDDAMRLLAAAPRVRQGFARAIAQNAMDAHPAVLRQECGDPIALARLFHAPIRDASPPARVIDAILQRLRGADL